MWWRIQSWRVIVTGSLIGILGTACSDGAPDYMAPTLGRIYPLCHIGCTETDPNPEAPGVFLGSGVTPFECFEAGHTDADDDGLSDFCEAQLAYAFRPEIAYSSVDGVGREPRWAAQGIGGDTVRIAYLPSYYGDWGTDHPLCVGPLYAFCQGHAGDSEWIALDVSYRSRTQHWLLKRALFSAHGNANIYTSLPEQQYVGLEYPEHPGTSSSSSTEG